MLTLLVLVIHFLYLFIRDLYLEPYGLQIKEETRKTIFSRFLHAYTITIIIDMIVFALYLVIRYV